MVMATEEVVDREPEVFADSAALDEVRLITKARRFAGKLPFVRHAVAMWYALRDDETPLAAKSVIVGALAYLVLPVDMVPDFIVAFGFADDAAVLATALKTVSSHMTPAHYGKADAALKR
jgi:uncharacterized membrane protein YkvA (DUF1232 family)